MSTLAINTHLYRWEGTDVNGERRQGEIRANSLAMIRAQLRRQGVNAAKVRRLGNAQSFINRAVNSSDITLFSRQLATLINAGIPLLQALEVIAKGFEQPATRQLVTDLTLDIAAGTSLSAALRKNRPTSMPCFAIWWKPGNRQALWMCCCNASPATGKSVRRWHKKSKRP